MAAVAGKFGSSLLRLAGGVLLFVLLAVMAGHHLEHTGWVECVQHEAAEHHGSHDAQSSEHGAGSSACDVYHHTMADLAERLPAGRLVPTLSNVVAVESPCPESRAREIDHPPQLHA